jgi:TATA-binding protein-associated factor
MPNFLGNEKLFNKTYYKPILASKDAKSNSKEQEEGTIALEKLHRQVLPFLLRRVKEDVLKDLPEKIIQDYNVELSPLQLKLYEDFSDRMEGAETEKWHVFQSLQYLRKLCNHPSLVLNEKHPKYSEIMNDLKSSNTNIHSIEHSPKLLALKDLIKNLILGEHRILIFAQYHSTLDLIEKDLFKVYLPEVTFMRIDGNTETSKRFPICQKFNSDPTIDVLLLTTRVVNK